MDKVVWCVGLVCLLVLLISPVACTVNRHRLVADAIKNGGDPIAVKCAIEGNDGPPPAICVIKAMEQQHD